MAILTKAASSNTVITGVWTLPTNAYGTTSDDQYATHTQSSRNGTAEIRYGFPSYSISDIPDGSTINSVKVSAEVGLNQSIGSVIDITIENPSGTDVGNIGEYSGSTADQVIESTATTIPTLQNLRDQTVFAHFLYDRANSAVSETIRIDYVSITVDYTAGATTVNASAQAQTHIKIIQRGFAQAQADIKVIANSYAQAQAEIAPPFITYNNYAQSMVIIKGLDYAYDTFTRTVNDGWGTAENGGDWTPVITPTSLYQVSSGVGQFILNPTDIMAIIELNEISIGDIDFQVDFYIPSLPPADKSNPAIGLISRASQNFNMTTGWIYSVEVDSLGATASSFMAYVGGTPVYSGGIVESTLSAATWYTVRVQVVNILDGTIDLRAKYWERGTQEPDWQHNINTLPDPIYPEQFAPGSIALLASAEETGYTISVDNLKAQRYISAGFAQAQAEIAAGLSTYNSYAQSLAQVKQTYLGHAQSLGQIKQLYSVYAQAISVTVQKSMVSAQASTWIKQTYKAYAQGQAQIKQTYRAYAQVQVQIKTTYRVYAQAQTQVEQAYLAYAQAQSQVKSQYQSYAQANATITVPSVGGDAYANAGALIGRIEDLYTAIDEVSADDTDFITTSLPTGFYTYRVELEPLNIPDWPIHHILRWRSDTRGTSNLGVQLYDGDTMITSVLVEPANGFQTFEYALSDLEINSIADYSSLIVEFTSTDRTYVSWVELQVPYGAPKKTYRKSGQAQAFIRVTYTYNAYAQAATQIVQSYQQYGQAQSHIVRTENAYAQAQTQIEATLFAYANAQATILQTYLSYANAQAQIEQTYQQYAQAQAQIRQTYLIFAQAQANVKNTYQAYAQAQGQIKQAYIVFANAQTSVKSMYQQYAQTQARILAFNVQAYGQAATIVEGSFTQTAQAQARILAYNVQAYAQAQAEIKATYRAYAQTNTWIKVTFQGYANAQTQIEQTYQAWAQANAYIFVRVFVHGQAQAFIISAREVYAQAQTQIKATYQTYSQANVWIAGAFIQSAQAQARIIAYAVNNYAQAQTQIKTTYKVYAQAKTWIEITSTVYAQARTAIEATYQAYAQANAYIKLVVYNYAQTQTIIKTTYTQSGQAGALIGQLYQVHANAQVSVKATVIIYAQAIAWIEVTSTAYGQAGALIVTYVQVYGQAITTVLATQAVFAQAQVFIVKATAVGQAAAYIRIVFILHKLIISDTSMTLVLSDVDPLDINIKDEHKDHVITDTKEFDIQVSDRAGLSLILSDRNYWG
jgi:hypothetical protein